MRVAKHVELLAGRHCTSPIRPLNRGGNGIRPLSLFEKYHLAEFSNTSHEICGDFLACQIG